MMINSPTGSGWWRWSAVNIAVSVSSLEEGSSPGAAYVGVRTGAGADATTGTAMSVSALPGR